MEPGDLKELRDQISNARMKGFSDKEIADHLSKKYGTEIGNARDAGFSDADILNHFAKGAAQQSPSPVRVGEHIAVNPSPALQWEYGQPEPKQLADTARDVFGLKQYEERGSVIPYGKTKEGEYELALPQIIADPLALTALPKHVAEGGQYTPEQAAQLALTWGVPFTMQQGRYKAPVKRKDLIAQAPSTETMKAAAGVFYKEADDIGLRVRAPSFVDDFLVGLEKRLVREQLDDVLHPRAARTFARMGKRVGDDIDLKDFDVWARQLNSATSSDDEIRLAGIIREEMDNFLGRIGADDISSGSADAVSALRQGKAWWARAKKSQTIDDIIDRADLSRSGFENGLRIEFGKLLKNKKAVRGFNEAEKALMRDIANGTPLTKALRYVGKMGPGAGGGSNWLGSYLSTMTGAALGSMLGGPTGALVGSVSLPAAGYAAQRGAMARTKAATDYLRAMAVTGEAARRGAGVPPFVQRVAPAYAGTMLADPMAVEDLDRYSRK